MGVRDKAVGFFLISAAALILVYYTCWVVILPFVPPSNFLHDFFPSQTYAVAIPATVLSMAVTVIAFVAGFVIMREKASSKQKQK